MSHRSLMFAFASSAVLVVTPPAIVAAPFAAFPGEARAISKGGDCDAAITVTSAADSGSGSLRQAVTDVCPEGHIELGAGVEVALATEILIDKPLTVAASSPGGVAGLQRILAGNGSRAFRVAVTGDLTLERIRISGGAVSEFGGAVHNSGTLTLIDCRMDGNRSGENITLGGGAIFSAPDATLVVDGCTFDGNLSPRGSAIFNSGVAQIRNSTFSDNINVGVVTEGAIQNRGNLVAEHITVTNNGRVGAIGTGGVFTFNATTTISNSIVAGNINNDCLFGGGTTTKIALLGITGNCAAQFTQDPRLEALGDNGGLTSTVALAGDSPARDVADSPLCPAVDQRGVARPQGSGCDLGAFEREVVGPALFGDGFESPSEPVR